MQKNNIVQTQQLILIFLIQILVVLSYVHQIICLVVDSRGAETKSQVPAYLQEPAYVQAKFELLALETCDQFAGYVPITTAIFTK